MDSPYCDVHHSKRPAGGVEAILCTNTKVPLSATPSATSTKSGAHRLVTAQTKRCSSWWQLWQVSHTLCCPPMPNIGSSIVLSEQPEQNTPPQRLQPAPTQHTSYVILRLAHSTLQLACQFYGLAYRQWWRLKKNPKALQQSEHSVTSSSGTHVGGTAIELLLAGWEQEGPLLSGS